ncbi:esterase/lipase family protein [Pseudarthrobacter sp. NPDC058196]|uniref:esterase/lipase family protein n=1 Tax=Pseudarthrobacter sp. NPDC058196 TaxID=3346376 RepID=UPI0036DDCB42
MSKPVDGKRPVPVILVHGWNGSTGTFTQPIDLFADGGNGGDGVKVPFSLTGQLENIPGLAVYNFDYSQNSNRWVTDSNVGPRLASAIECLTDFYGTKAEIIAHSMGGLAARFALDQKASKGPAIKDRVSQVVTFGTPNTGSAVAALAAKAIANGAASNLTRPNVASGVALAAWIITYICGRQMTHSTTELTFPCDNLPSFVTGFDSDAGQALRSGSPQLQALAAWPSTVHVTAVEGSTMFRGISLFGAGTDGPGINGGDVIVANDSASAGSGTVKDESCGFALSARADGGDTVLQAFGPTSGAVNDGFILHIIDKTNPCFHQNLLRTINGTNAAVGAVKPEAANPVLITGVAGSYTDRLPSDGPAPSGSALLPVTGTLAPGFEARPPGIKWFHDVPRAFGEARDALTLRLNTSDGVPHYFDHSVAVEAACTGDQAIAFDEFSTDKGAYSKAVFTLYFHNTKNPDQPVTPGRRVRVRVLAGTGGSIWLGSTAKEIMNSVYTTGDPLPSFSVNVSGYGVIAILPTFDTCQMTAGIGTELVDSGFVK